MRPAVFFAKALRIAFAVLCYVVAVTAAIVFLCML